MPKKFTLDDFIKKASIIHNNKYDYSLAKYVNVLTHIEIICPIHGSFFQLPGNHINKKVGCYECGKISANIAQKTQTFSTDKFINDAKKIHGDKYDYSLVNYTGAHNHVKIICMNHGIFHQTPSKHIHCKNGCPICGNDLISQKLRLDKDEFIIRSNKIHNNKYDYSLVDYINAYTYIKIICPIHGIFEQLPTHHLNNESGCYKCTRQISNQQINLYNYIANKINNVILEDRINYKPYLIDISIPNKNICIEYNGVYWHRLNEYRRDIYHINRKRLALESLGLRVLNIYEDEWNNFRSKIGHIIKNALDIQSYLIDIKNCIIWKCDSSQNNFKSHIIPFLNTYHLEELNSIPESIAYCLVYDNQIVACALFGDSELIKYCTIFDTKIENGVDLLIQEFHNDFPQFKSISTQIDNRFFTGNTYKKIGFKKIKETDIQLSIINNGKRNYFSDNIDNFSIYSGHIVPDCGRSIFTLEF